MMFNHDMLCGAGWTGEISSASERWACPGLTLAQWLALKAHGQVADAKAKSVIQLFMVGGPSHLDTFDPKPEAGNDYCGPLKNPIATNVPGIRISELLPLTAKQADKYSIIRSYTHQDFGHETAAYTVATGACPAARWSIRPWAPSCR